MTASKAINMIPKRAPCWKKKQVLSSIFFRLTIFLVLCASFAHQSKISVYYGRQSEKVARWSLTKWTDYCHTYLLTLIFGHLSHAFTYCIFYWEWEKFSQVITIIVSNYVYNIFQIMNDYWEAPTCILTYWQ